MRLTSTLEWAQPFNEHLYSPRMVEEIKEEKMEHQTNKQVTIIIAILKHYVILSHNYGIYNPAPR